MPTNKRINKAFEAVGRGCLRRVSMCLWQATMAVLLRHNYL
ncbi:hypothetical protein FORC20_4282 [Salmonella enterica subsp. enterica serovar Typhimurium]|nr:hypothetical protein FORC20_4282 [Salmonella enterica subsp. enterica serovar Typhimurium]